MHLRLFHLSLFALFLGVSLLAPQAQAQDRVEPAKKYRRALEPIAKWIEQERLRMQIPSIAVAVVDDRDVVWAQGFGSADAAGKRPATANTLYRVGSVSKPTTALVLMQLVEAGTLDLDAPIQKYLPDFRPRNPYKQNITLRQMLAHRSGIVRESPVGNYFDDTGPSLADTVKSLNATELLYKPTTKTSYSNAAVSVAGYVLERKLEKPFAQIMQEKLLAPLGMTSSGFAPTDAMRKRQAHALMATWHGRRFDAPRFELGTIPAGNLYSSANDMAKLMKFLFAEGRGPKGQLLQAKTLEQMWQPQFSEDADTKSGFGISFYVSEFEGRKKIGHGGAVYGYSTELACLPDEKLGVLVFSSRDFSNGLTQRIGVETLRALLAVREGKPVPKIAQPKPIPYARARKLDGRYRLGDKEIELSESLGKLWLLANWVGLNVEVRQLGDALVVDDPKAYGAKFVPGEEGLRLGEDVYRRVKETKPAPVKEKWKGLIGEYGWDHNVMFVLEREGKLHVLIEWFFLYPLTEVSDNVYRFPDFGMYKGDKLVFKRDKTGKATEVNAASVVFKRRHLDGEDGKTFTLKPVRPIPELRKIALKAKPPIERGDFRKSDMVDLETLDKTLKFDIRYATKNNFLQTPFYTMPKAYMQRPAGQALLEVHRKLASQGYGLLIHDSYRPWHVSKMFWDATPVEYHDFVADPSQGSRHNRGCAVDLTLYDLKTGKVIPMVAGFDEFSDRAYPDYPGGTSLQRWHRKLLRRAMEDAGFTIYEIEWWHFDYRDWRKYGIQNATFEELQEQPAESAPLFKGLGNLHFPVSTQSKRAQRYIDQGLILAYGFNHAEAARSFRAAQALDPDCAMAYWGEALVLGPNINAKMVDDAVAPAWTALQKAKAAKNATPRERDYIEALSARYVEKPIEDRSKLDLAYANAMRKLAAKYPDDYNAHVLFAESLMDTTPWDYWLEGGKPKPVTTELLRTLERVLARHPMHPGANHLYIHAVEAAHPKWGEASADRLRNLVPGAGHLVHMPSHIYIRVGRYADATLANEKAIAADDAYVTQCHAQGAYPLGYMPHNHHFLWFAASMEGRAKESIHAARHIAKHTDPKIMRQPGFGTLQHFFSMEMYALVRFGQWKEVLAIPQPAKDLKYPTGVWHFTQGLALLRQGNADKASEHHKHLAKLAKDTSIDEVKIWDNTSTRRILEIGEAVLAGEIALAKGDVERGLRQLRRGVELEDAMPYEEPQLWYAPVRQAYGAALLKTRQLEKAEKVFREDLARYPRNGWSLFGLSQALKAQGKTKEAERVQKEFAQAWKRADVELTSSAF